MSRFFQWFNNLYPIWLLSLSIAAFFHPPLMLWFDKQCIFWALAASMLGMGLTLTPEDFRSVARMPAAVAAGFVGQFTIMPLLGWAAGRAFGLEPAFAVGLILVACCPGGTASNVVTYLAGANVGEIGRAHV